MTDLRLAAFDEEDLDVLSAQVQDAVLKVSGIDWRPREKRLILAMNRFAWDVRGTFTRRNDERRSAVLQFDRVRAVRSAGIRRDRAEDVLELLALRFLPSDTPSGTIELDFAGNATMRLDVECIEARLTDLGARWQASSRPLHKV